MHFGPLFLLWVAVLRLSLFALIGGLITVELTVVRDRLCAAPAKLVGGFLIAAGGLFALVWLKNIVPALLSGRTPQAVSDADLPTSCWRVAMFAGAS